MEKFLEKAKRHVVPSIIGCAFGTLVAGGNALTFLLSLPFCIAIITLIWDKLGLDNEVQ